MSAITITPPVGQRLRAMAERIHDANGMIEALEDQLAVARADARAAHEAELEARRDAARIARRLSRVDGQLAVARDSAREARNAERRARRDAEAARAKANQVRKGATMRDNDSQPARTIDRLAVNKKAASDLLGVSVEFFDEHVVPELRTIRRGRRMLVPVAELEAWLDRAAERVGPVSRSSIHAYG